MMQPLRLAVGCRPSCLALFPQLGAPTMHDAYSDSRTSVRQDRRRKRAPCLYLSPTSPSPSGGFAQKFKIEHKIARYRAITSGKLMSKSTFLGKAPSGRGEIGLYVGSPAADRVRKAIAMAKAEDYSSPRPPALRLPRQPISDLFERYR